MDAGGFTKAEGASCFLFLVTEFCRAEVVESVGDCGGLEPGPSLVLVVAESGGTWVDVGGRSEGVCRGTVGRV